MVCKIRGVGRKTEGDKQKGRALIIKNNILKMIVKYKTKEIRNVVRVR